MSVSQGKRFDLARDSSVKGISAQGWSTSGLATQVTASANLAQLAAGVSPTVPNYQTGEQILQDPSGSPYTLFTMPGNGRLWAALVSFSMGSSGGAGSNHGYARVMTGGGKTLAIVECVIVGNPSTDSGTAALAFNGFPVNSGVNLELDVNGGAAITGVTLRASGLVGVSVP